MADDGWLADGGGAATSYDDERAIATILTIILILFSLSHSHNCS
jgi:hypothetical protein